MEKSPFVDQTLRQVEALLAAHPTLFARQGAVVASWRIAGGARRGPYYSLRYRQDGRQQSLYLGASAARAAAVRQWLTETRRPRRESLDYARQRAAVRRALRAHLPAWRRDLASAGLAWKGSEIRRLKSLRLPTPPPSPTPGPARSTV
jgi:hypothetical protein